MFKIEGACEVCQQNMAVEEVLDCDLLDYVSVCEDCFKSIFTDVANQGIQTFYEWACDNYGDIKALGLCKEIYGENAVKEMLGVTGDSMEMMTMFTYGILKYRHNIEREGGKNIVENSTIKGHQIYLYNNSFPITQITGNDSHIVYGTLFDVPKYMVLNQYDFIEGYDPKRHSSMNMYNRIEVEVTTPTGEKKMAQMYYANQHMFREDINKRNYIPTGNFDDRHLAISYGQKKYRKRGK